jgi:hypothetical protein
MRVTLAYARMMAQRGGCRRGYPKAVGILAGGQVHLCVFVKGDPPCANGEIRGSQENA